MGVAGALHGGLEAKLLIKRIAGTHVVPQPARAGHRAAHTRLARLLACHRTEPDGAEPKRTAAADQSGHGVDAGPRPLEGGPCCAVALAARLGELAGKSGEALECCRAA